MRVGYADHAGVAGRRGYAPATQARCDGEGRDFHTKRSLQEGKGKTDALTLLSQAYFSECCQGQASSARKRDLTEIEYPLLVKRVFIHPPPRHRGYAAKPRRPPPPMRVGYADHAGVAGRRGYAPATQARCDGEGRDFTPNAVSKRVRAKLMPLPSYRKRIFRVLSRSSPLARKRDLDRDRIPAFSKAGIQPSPSPPPRLRRLLSPRRPPPPMRVGYADHAGVAGRRGYAPATQARCDGEGGTSHQTQSPRG